MCAHTSHNTAPNAILKAKECSTSPLHTDRLLITHSEPWETVFLPVKDHYHLMQDTHVSWVYFIQHLSRGMNSKIGTVHVLWCDIKMNLLWVRVGSWLNYICVYIRIHTDTYMIESLIAGSKTYLKVIAFSRLWAHLIPTVTLGDSRHILVISQKSKLRLRDWVTCRRPLNFWVSGLGCEPR